MDGLAAWGVSRCLGCVVGVGGLFQGGWVLWCFVYIFAVLFFCSWDCLVLFYCFVVSDVTALPAVLILVYGRWVFVCSLSLSFSLSLSPRNTLLFVFLEHINVLLSLYQC